MWETVAIVLSDVRILVELRYLEVESNFLHIAMGSSEWHFTV